jgi:sorbitol/mannitol transport system substrate-binding protein
MTIGMYETPIWGKKGWLQELKPDAAYDVDDPCPPFVRVSVDGKLYAALLRREFDADVSQDSSRQSGVKLSDHPTWAQVKDLAAKIHNPQAGVYGICLRQAGLGRQHGLPDHLVNTNGGQWFDMTGPTESSPGRMRSTLRRSVE